MSDLRKAAKEVVKAWLRGGKVGPEMLSLEQALAAPESDLTELILDQRNKLWRDAYILELARITLCGQKCAAENYEAGLGEHEYDDDPKYAAEQEAMCWCD